MKRKSVCTTAKQRTEASRQRCWWRTVGMPVVRAAVKQVVDDYFAGWEARMQASIDRMDCQLRFGTDYPPADNNKSA